MRDVWLAVLAGAGGCYALKLSGLSVPRRVIDRPSVRRVVELVPVALLATLVLLQTFATGTRLVVDARLFGILVAAAAVLLRAPFLVVVALAVGATALLRGLLH